MLVENVTINIIGAIILEPFKTYVVETDQYFSQKTKDKILNYLHSESDSYFVILDAGMKIARAENNS